MLKNRTQPTWPQSQHTPADLSRHGCPGHYAPMSRFSAASRDNARESAMGYDKGHKEFHGVDMKDGFHNVPGYPWGFSEKILAGSLDEKNKVGNRTRILKIEPGVFSNVPFVYEYWEEVFLVSVDLVRGGDE